MPKTKYKNEEEKKQANRINAKNWYERHKNDEQFKNKRRSYMARYKNALSDAKKQFLREYNSDYVFYVKNVKTGKFEKRIAKTKQQLLALQDKLEVMQNRLYHIKNKFGHLDENK